MESRQLADLRAERLIATGRVALAALLLLAITIDPHAVSRLAPLGYSLGALYVGYALLIFAAAWAPESPLQSLRVVTHVLDLLAFTAIIYFTDGATSPFFVFLVFALVAAALRWQWRGVLSTAAAALGAYLIVAASGHPPVLTLFIRGTYLAVFAVLLGFLGTHQRRLQRDIDQLATWPVLPAGDPSTLSRALLEKLVAALSAQEAVIVWSERDGTSACVISSSPTGVVERRLLMPLASAVVSTELAGRAFITRAGRRADGTVVYLQDGALHRWRGAALGRPLLDEVPGGPLLSLPVESERMQGRIFVGRSRPFADEDLVLGHLLLRQVLPQLDRACEGARDRRDAALQERMRLAQDLHDGVIQSLTGASLRLHSVDRLLEEKPARAHELLAEVDDLLIAEQRELRWFLTEQREGSDWNERLRQLSEHMARNWDMTVWMQIPGDGPLVGDFGHEVYRIVQEALANAARHGGARSATVHTEIEHGALRLIVEDDGHGFAFRGDFDDAALREQRLGPVSIKQRIAALGGRLRIRSHETGARLEAWLPLMSTVS